MLFSFKIGTLALAVVAIASNPIGAAEPAAASSISPERNPDSPTAGSLDFRTYTTGGWQFQESAGFRVCSRGALPNDQVLATALESLRASLSRKWLGDDRLPVWRPKCEIILHTSEKAYLRAVPGGTQTVGSSLIESEYGRIVTRRIDVRADQPGWLNAAVAHELTHVVLADVFANAEVPRWADEGMAVLADTPEKQQLHLRDLRDARQQGNHWRMVELFTLAGYPDERRQAAFYGQSVSVVKFLVERGSPEQFRRFVQASLKDGYDHALNDVYQIRGLRELEQHWTAAVVREESLAQSRKLGRSEGG
ncbi:MAG TPA: hypothetical protein VND64_20775 [Pirellulales bacterium]|nr:hypothetical protein [Pirellulales bacterium]